MKKLTLSDVVLGRWSYDAPSSPVVIVSGGAATEEDLALLKALDEPHAPYSEGDIDPVCAARNPWLDQWHGNCCRFPKSCSPHMNAARAAQLNAATPTGEAEHVPCGCDKHGDHAGCRAGCDLRGCRAAATPTEVRCINCSRLNCDGVECMEGPYQPRTPTEEATNG